MRVLVALLPELVAAFPHLESIDATIQQALDDANLSLTDIDAVAVTSGPGLAGALMGAPEWPRRRGLRSHLIGPCTR